MTDKQNEVLDAIENILQQATHLYKLEKDEDYFILLPLVPLRDI